MAVFSIGIAGGDVLNGWIKNHVKRVRPENHLMETAGFSLPSGHAMVGLIFFSMAAYLIMNEIKGNSLKWAVGSGNRFRLSGPADRCQQDRYESSLSN